MRTTSIRGQKNTHTNVAIASSRYRPEVDGLRAFAVVAVIINHFNKEILPGGYLGVDIFFVISGYVITSSLFERPSKDFKDFISGFYERRIKRLVPALSVFVLITSTAICLFNPSPHGALRTGITSLFGLSNLYLFKQSTDYFAQTTELNVFTHTWSLGVEEQFYLLFPVIAWLSGFSRQTNNGERNLFISAGILSILSLSGFLSLYTTNQPAAYFLMPSRFWEMAAGCMVFIGLQKRKAIEHNLERISPLLVLFLAVATMYLPPSFAATSTLIIVILSSILIACLKKTTLAFRVFTDPRVVYIGLISYSLYLWHWGVLSISRWTIGIHWWSIPLQAALMLGLAVASYRYIETPLRKASWFGKRWKTLVAGGGALMVLSGSLEISSKPLSKNLFAGSQYNKWNMNTYQNTHHRISANAPSIYLIGDSHAVHFGSLMTYLAKKNSINHYQPQADELGLSSNDNMERYVLEPINKYKDAFKAGDLIIFSAQISKYGPSHRWTRHYETFIEETKELSLRYAIISPTPNFPGVLTGDICSSEWYRPKWAVSPKCFSRIKKEQWLKEEDESFASLKKFANKYPKVTYIDALSIICPDSYCNNHEDNFLLYRDDNHLSSRGAMKLKSVIEALLND